MNILFFGHTKSVFVKDLIQNLLKTNSYHFFIFDFLSGVIYDVTAGKNICEVPVDLTKRSFIQKLKILLRLRKMARFLTKTGIDFDVCHIHYLDARYFFIRKTILRFAKKNIASIYGSDFTKYRKYSLLQSPFYKKSSAITFTNQQLADDFSRFYKNKYDSKITICRFGLSLLDFIKEKSGNIDRLNILNDWSLPLDKTFIIVGYSSNPNSRHIEIIDEISALDPVLKKGIFLIFPMTYGGYNQQILAVRNRMNSVQIDYLILDKFLPNEKFAELRMISDIFVHLPFNDQLSGAMQETLFARNIVLTGEWLPYTIFERSGIFYHKLKSVSGIKEVLPDIINNLNSEKMKCGENSDAIWNLSSWEKNIQHWNKLYN